MRMKYLILLLLICNIECALRFKDDGMMESHHNHQDLAQNKRNLTVHVLCHSHDDVGWLKTLDDYYYGNNNKIQWAGVQHIIDSVIKYLIKYPHLKYQQVEMAFFSRWWNNQTPQMQERVKKLVKDGQLIFINGGWCMSDEATPYYEDMIDQMTIGHKWILDNFNVTPTIGWHIDPFGHQSTVASLFSQMGFNGWFFARIDYQDKNKRMDEKRMEMIWVPPQASGDKNYIFTGVLYYHYSPPPGFNYELFQPSSGQRSPPIIDDSRLEGYNIEERAQRLTDYFNNMSAHYDTDNLMHTFGEDFAYTQANTWFKNIDKLVNHINANPTKYNIKLKYSSPQEYLDAINAENKTYEENNYDFLPYSDNENSFWTGYFVSRSSLKYHTKKVGRYLQSVRNWIGLLRFYNASRYLIDYKQSVDSALDTLEEAMGVLQHHDAVAGTEKQKVADDYTFILSNATATMEEEVFGLIKEDYKTTQNETLRNFQSCDWNLTSRECDNLYNNLKQNIPVLMSVYNPSQQRQHLIRFKVPNYKFNVRGQNNSYLDCEVMCTNATDAEDCEAYFVADLDSFSLNYFKLLPVNEPNRTAIVKGLGFPYNTLNLTIGLMKGRSIKFHKYTNQLTFTDAQKNEHNFEFKYKFYYGYQNRNAQSSGAYIFRPDSETLESPINYGSEMDKKFYSGRIVQAIYFENEHVDCLMRFFNLPNETIYDSVIEQETFLKPVNISDGRGKEITLDWWTQGLNNGNTFYTDSNGLEVQKRVFNERPTWKWNITQQASGNYYPINSQITLRDETLKKGFTVIPDRSQAGTSQASGHVQIMLQRRLLFDDWRGVGDALNETQPWDNSQGVTTSLIHTLVFYSLSDSTKNLPRLIQIRQDQKPLQYFSQTGRTYFTNQTSKKNYPLVQQLDPLLKFYLRPYSNGKYLFRIHSLSEYDQLTFNYKSEFTTLLETTLTGNQAKSDWEKKQLKWQTQLNKDIPRPNWYYMSSNTINQKESNALITVKPLQIRTYIVS